MAVARVHVRAWQRAYRGLLPQDYLDRLHPKDRAARYDFASADSHKPQTIVAEVDGVIQGVVTTAPSRATDLPDDGELCALYVNPEQWGRGIGVALVQAGRARLREAGFRDAFLWVLMGNVRAERFYQIDGWAADGERKTDVVWGVTVEEMRFRRRLELPY